MFSKPRWMINFLVGFMCLTSSICFADRGHFDRHWHGAFHTRDVSYWHAGYWSHGFWEGRLGWWWIVGGVRYYYPVAVYPYPDFYVPPVVTPAVVPATTTPLPPNMAQAQTAPVPAPSNNWYYCDAVKNYYPYVAQCPAGWVLVPATPVR